MKRKSSIKSVVFFYVLLTVLLALTVLGVALYNTYITTIEKASGEKTSSEWPSQYTYGFSKQIVIYQDKVAITAEGKESLKKNKLWIQILDNTGKDIDSYQKPADLPSTYSISDLLEIKESNSLKKETVFIGEVKLGEENFEYIIGFPMSVSKITSYYNAERYFGNRPIVSTVFLALIFIIVVCGIAYGIWLSRHMQKITSGASEIADRKYSKRKEKGAFSDVYKSLNLLDDEIASSDKKQAETQRMREEWIANITHDIKTPLSPIRGYAEILVSGEYPLTDEEVKAYGEIMLKNVRYTEELVNDLKLTYQLKSGELSIKKENVNLVRLLKEITIDILNMPDFAEREIEFISNKDEIICLVDASLIRRAISNVLINALTHNPKDTEIMILLQDDKDIEISVADNGSGMTAEETENLFNRYYRGTSTDEKPQGSGLGLAITRQIVEIHSGTVLVKSERNKGTTIKILLPST